jgi:hypothetical protein
VGRYLPAFRTQRVDADPCARYNCVAYSGAMALDYATLGGLSVSGRTVRELTGEPTCPSPTGAGLTPAQLATAGKALHVPLVARLDQTWAELVAEVGWQDDPGMGAVVFLHYGTLAPELRSSGTFTGDHAVFLHAFLHGPPTARVRVGDPLAAGWKLWPAGQLKAAMAAFPGPGFDWVRTRDVPELA